jgi:hypothetical protein
MEDIEAMKQQQINVEDLAAVTDINKSTTKIHSTQNGGIIINNNNNSVKTSPNGGTRTDVTHTDNER